MASKFKFLLLYYTGWVVFFELMRVLFLVYHHDKAADLPAATLLATIWYGLRMDLSVAAYILIPVCIFVLLSLFIHFFRRLLIYRIYTVLVLLLVSIISLTDMELYAAWGFRIDGTVLTFLKTPAEAFASVSHRPLFFIGIVFLLAYGLFYFCFRFLLRRIFFSAAKSPVSAYCSGASCIYGSTHHTGAWWFATGPIEPERSVFFH